MALTTWFRGSWFIKDFIVKYLNYIFYANSKGKLYFFDGTKNFEFSARPHVAKRGSWVTRPPLPLIIVGEATGNMESVAFTRDLLKVSHTTVDSTTVTESKTYGGDFDLDVTIEIWGTTGEERDRLTDVIGIYLSHPDAKYYFNQHYLKLPENLSISGDREVFETGIDHPIYAKSVSLHVVGRWEDTVDTDCSTLSDIITDISAVMLDADWVED